MDLNLNSPYRIESFAYYVVGKKPVISSFETPEYYASKGLVRPWQRNRINSLMVKSKGVERNPNSAIGKMTHWIKNKRNGILSLVVSLTVIWVIVSMIF